MIVIQEYDRWLTNRPKAVPESDWGPAEYYQWQINLKEAAQKLEEAYKYVDEEIIDIAKSICESNPPKAQTGQLNYGDLAKVIVRYIISYNFYGRASFEGLQDDEIVQRVQKHLGKLQVAIPDIQVARMLQDAMDKVRAFLVLFG
jgi:hypothetical protein